MTPAVEAVLRIDPPPLKKVGDRRAHPQPHRFHVYRDDPVEVVLGILVRAGLRAIDACVVEDVVQAAGQTSDFVDGVGEFVQFGDVSGQGPTGPAFSLDLTDDGGAVGAGQVHHRDRCAL